MEITIGNVIKIILAIAVIVAAGYTLYRFFSDKVIDFFKNAGVNTSSIKLLLSLLA